MPEYQFGNSTITVGADLVAKITSIRRNMTFTELDVTGAEDVSGVLVAEKFLPVSLGQSYDVEFISTAGTGATGTPQYSAGQEALFDAARLGTEITLLIRKPTIGGGVDKGWDVTGFITAMQEGGAVKDVYKGSFTFRVNTAVEVLT